METVNQKNAKDVKNNFDGIKNDIDEINKTIKNYRPVWNKAGKTFEYVVLERLKTTMGSNYARGFTIRSLADLAEETLPVPVEILPSEKSKKSRRYI